MGSNTYRLHPEKKLEAFKLREAGHSYREIQKKLGVKSRGTLSFWFRDLKLSHDAKDRLKKYTDKASTQGFLAFNKNRTLRILKEDAQAESEGQKLIGSLTKRDLMIVGAALYWGEGTKRIGTSQTPRLVFTNSDPEMVRLFMRFAREILKVPSERFRADLHLYPSIDTDGARKFWSDLTKIPEPRFWCSNNITRASSGKRPIHKLPYGTIAVYISNRLYFKKVKGMIKALK